MKEYLIFSERLKEAMKQNNRMTQMELSKITGITNVSISRYVNGQRIPKATDLGDVMQTNIDKLKARFPEGFSVERSINRVEGDV